MAVVSAALILVLFMICDLPVAIGHRDDCTPGTIIKNVGVIAQAKTCMKKLELHPFLLITK